MNGCYLLFLIYLLREFSFKCSFIKPDKCTYDIHNRIVFPLILQFWALSDVTDVPKHVGEVKGCAMHLFGFVNCFFTVS